MGFSRRPFSRALAALLLLAAPALGQGQVWVVDDGGGAGVDFTAIQPAVDAASDGDLVLVKSGTYVGFTIDDEHLTVIADAGAAVSFASSSAPIRVQNLGASRSVALRGLGVTPPMTSQYQARSEAVSNAGPLWIEDCLFTIRGFSPALSITASSSVALLGCTVPPSTQFLNQADGLVAASSSVHGFDSDIQGSVWPGSVPGGAGADVANGFLFVSGSTLRGGSYPSCSVGTCSAHTGEAGLILGPGAVVEQLETDILGGSGSTGPTSFCGVPCTAGPPGPDVVQAGGTLNVMAEASRSFEVSSPIRAGQSATLTAQGNPGDFVVGLYAFRQQHTFLPNIGTLLVPLAIGTETGFVVLGATGPTGSLVATVPFAPFPPGLEFLQIYLQAAFLKPQPVIIVGGGSLLVVLNQSL